MITEGSIVRYVGKNVASQNAQRYAVNDCYPDDIASGALGVCEYFAGLSVLGYKLYRCRFLDPRKWMFEHWVGKFYFFEIEEI